MSLTFHIQTERIKANELQVCKLPGPMRARRSHLTDRFELGSDKGVYQQR